MKIEMWIYTLSLGQFNRKAKKYSKWVTNWSFSLCVFQNFFLSKWNDWSEKGKRLWNLKKIYIYGFRPIVEI